MLVGPRAEFAPAAGAVNAVHHRRTDGRRSSSFRSVVIRSANENANVAVVSRRTPAPLPPPIAGVVVVPFRPLARLPPAHSVRTPGVATGRRVQQVPTRTPSVEFGRETHKRYRTSPKSRRALSDECFSSKNRKPLLATYTLVGGHTRDQVRCCFFRVDPEIPNINPIAS